MISDIKHNQTNNKTKIKSYLSTSIFINQYLLYYKLSKMNSLNLQKKIIFLSKHKMILIRQSDKSANIQLFKCSPY